MLSRRMVRLLRYWKPHRTWRPDHRQARLTASPDGGLQLTNVRSGYVDGKPVFREAEVDPAGVTEVYLAIEPFAPTWLAGHAMLVFELASPAEPLVVSIEPRRRRGQPYSMVRGLGRTYPMMYLLETWSDVVGRACHREGHYLVRYRLALTQNEKERLLRHSLEVAGRSHREFYNTVTNSCLGAALRLLNEVLAPERRLREWLVPRLVYNPIAALPPLVDLALAWKGVLAKEPPVVTCAAEPPARIYGRLKSRLRPAPTFEGSPGLTAKGLACASSL